jgi:hypothetical protein
MAPSGSPIHCERCLDLEIVEAVSQWQWRSTTSVHDPRIMQRLLFDSHYPLDDSCRTCRRMNRFLSCRRVQFIPTATKPASPSNQTNTFGLPSIQLRSWDRPASEENGHTLHFGISPPADLSLPGLAQPKWRVEYVQEVTPQPDWARIKSWLHHCSVAHTGCGPSTHPQLRDLRVVDVDSRMLVPLPDGATYLVCDYVFQYIDDQF